MSIFTQKAESGFVIGDLITGQDEGETVQAIVLDKDEDSGALLVMRLPANDPVEVTPGQLAGWVLAAELEARWVEVYDGDEEEPFFAAYVPGFDAAVAIHRAFEKREGEFHVLIYPANQAEAERLRQMGYESR
jgi:hypothetical protein